MSNLKDKLSQLAKNISDLSGCVPEEAPCTSRFVLYNASKQLNLAHNGVLKYIIPDSNIKNWRGIKVVKTKNFKNYCIILYFQDGYN